MIQKVAQKVANNLRCQSQILGRRRLSKVAQLVPFRPVLQP